MEDKLLVVMLVCTLAGAAPVFGQIYKWVDENGTVHFSDTPPSTPPAGRVEMRDTKPPPPVLKGQPSPVSEAKAPTPPPSATADDDVDEDIPEADDMEDVSPEADDSGSTISTGDELIYDPNVIDRLRLEKLRREGAGSTGGGAGVPARPARGGGRRR